MSILLTGGTGQTSSRVSRILQASGKRVLIASRNPSSAPPTPTSQSIKFDWADPSTYENAFTTSFGRVESAYLISPGQTTKIFDQVKGFIDFLIGKGVKRLVLLSGASVVRGGPSDLGKVHEYIVNLGVDYAVIRPSWFFENTLTFHAHSIRTNDEIISASEDGKIGFIGADDIADLVAEALLVEKSFNTDIILTGPELLTYDQVAEIFSSVLGRPIKHTRLSEQELKKLYLSVGLPEDYAGLLAFIETLNAAGGEERNFAAPNKRTGKITLREFVEKNKEAWVV